MFGPWSGNGPVKVPAPGTRVSRELTGRLLAPVVRISRSAGSISFSTLASATVLNGGAVSLDVVGVPAVLGCGIALAALEANLAVFRAPIYKFGWVSTQTLWAR